MPLLSTIGAAAARAFGFLRALVTGGYNVANSLRFNAGSTDYLSKNSWATATSDKIFTYSTWVKRSQLANTERLFGAYAGSPQVYSCDLSFTSNNGYIEFTFGGANAYDIVTNAMFRDISAWYHVILAVDTTQATDTNRIKIYVNNTLQTLQTANYPPQNSTYQVFRNNNANLIGSAWNGGAYYTGYMSETYFIDGQQLTPSSFGQTDPSVPSSGIWIPKAYSGSFGTNGFYLKFANSAALGTDSSGNGNNFTVNNLTSVDQSTDTPTNNFATLNPLDVGGGGSYAEGNLQYTSATSDLKASASSFALNNGGAGKWYWEVKMVSTTGSIYQIGTISSTSGYNASPHSQYSSGGQVYINGSLVTTVATYTTNDIISVAFDATISEVKFYKNGSLQTTQTITNSSNILMFAGSHSDSSGNTATYQFNFGSPPFTIASGNADANGYGNFEYAVPSGYYALNTKNLADYG